MPEAEETPAAETNPPPEDEPVWRFRGYEMRPAEFNTAMVHYYRAEIQRSNTWRMRLDNTTNWAVITSSAAITFVLAAPTNHYGVLILTALLITLFLGIEARRYRYYELWSYRARLMETDFFAAMLVPPFAPHPDWAESLAESLLQPEFPISIWEAFGRRFRRNYMWLFAILMVAWLLKVLLHPTPTTTFADLLARTAVGPLPGWLMLLAGVLYNGVLFIIGFATVGLTQASGEVLPKYVELPGLRQVWQAMEDREAAARHTGPRPPGASARPAARRRQELLAFVITVQPNRIADRIMQEMRRGVTGLHGRGMYSKQDREVLMVAVTVTEIANLKAIVQAEDPNAFVIVTAARDVFGRGFQPLAS